MLARASSASLSQLASSGLAALSAAHCSRRAVGLLPAAPAIALSHHINAASSSCRSLSTAHALGQATPAAAAAADSSSSSNVSILEEDGSISTPHSPRPVTTRTYTNATLRRQALKQTQPWYIGHAALRKIRLGGFGQAVRTKLPHELRPHKPEYEMLRLRKEEALRLSQDPARQIDDFAAGDKIVVTKYLSLNDRTKFERIAGLCLARQKGDRLSASFLMKAHKLGEDYELRFPIYSPFIARIQLLERSERNFRQKMYYLRDGPKSNWEAKIPQGLSKPSVPPMSVDRVAKESGGRVVVLTSHPMKKQLKQKRSGGIGAELAAAGGGADKKGSLAKGPPPAKNAKK